MQDFLYRDDAPLTPEEWARLDETVVTAARRMLVGRRFLDLFGPLGAGLQDIDYNLYEPGGEAVISLLGNEEPNFVQPLMRVHQHLPMIYKDFLLFWRDIENAHLLHAPLDLGAAATAAVFVAQREDDLLFNGNESFGIQGLLTARGAHAVEAGAWGEPGNAFRAVAAAIQTLLSDGFPPPYAVVVNPVAYAQIQRIFECSGVLELARIRELAQGGVFETPAIRHTTGVVVALGPQNVDLAIGQDLTTGYLGPDGLNHPFRVFETLALRIKRPRAICLLQGPGPESAAVGGEAGG